MNQPLFAGKRLNRESKNKSMKKSLLIFSMACTASSFAQITVNQGNLVVAGDVVIQNNDTLPSVSGPTTGTNQTWDYSALVAHTEDTMNFVAPGWLANSADFPTATLGATFSQGVDIYLEKDASGLRNIGFAANFFGGSTAVHIDPSETIIQFPATYNDMYADTSRQRMSFDGASVGLPVDSVVNISLRYKNVHIDAWGSLTTPYGTFDVIASNETTISYDSTFTYLFGSESLVDSGVDTSYHYTFWSDDPSAKFPVMELELDDQGNVLSATWLKEAPSAGLDLIEVEVPVVFPNPTTDGIYLNAADGALTEVVVYDMNGSAVISMKTSGDDVYVDLRSIAKGTYLVKGFGSNGQVLLTEEVVKQ